MFTGIITHKAEVITMESNKLVIKVHDFLLPNIGESIAINGVCLTVRNCHKQKDCVNIEFDLLDETLSCTNLSDYKPGMILNLEPAARANTLMGGHIISGHVDTKLTLFSNDDWQLKLQVEEKHLPLIIPKGSIAINGVSLTIQSVEQNSLTVCLIPETVNSTNLMQILPGSNLNVEFDAIAKTVWHQLQLLR